MKPQELMIGDWVFLNGSFYQISEISQKGWAHLSFDGCQVAMSNDYLLDELQPVRITEYNLKKNGFYFENGLAIYDGDDYEVYVDIHDQEIRIMYQHILVVLVHSFCELKLYELQHALRQSGIEKEIVL